MAGVMLRHFEQRTVLKEAGMQVQLLVADEMVEVRRPWRW